MTSSLRPNAPESELATIGARRDKVSVLVQQPGEPTTS